ncbi:MULTISPECIES: acetoin utilization protein AcuC [Oceanobacillus]|uniref:Acetoin utilization protein AcuC n=1 Tax=Oceanobacillus kimchii TaxID=746691 RepID=A0ABQ5TJ38_9BACI|nr:MULTISPECIES: acetoin utilization protein AcuC [Oceanobacillus]MBT2600778.1 acetoin utilization protein AcuC [Oceanobacillus sp. ISL-74]MBT2650825.1 acetoin utilization protein AcuC [Oceanobacillus sp. ISL-73]MCT1575533.1 acetoin utilization protein AcuC [Oceanobacillus kimchii]MCT2137164.1 acetoin utilization protein AcuC [Oceanobacillus kimchii]GLO66888.1 acetoin utilization protein AcuC [Oceanobacillus kimchii]
MTGTSGFVYSSLYLKYHFHEQHPFNQKRVLLTKELLEAHQVLSDCDLITPRLATEEELLLFHHPDYIEAVKRAGSGEITEERALEYGIGTEDTPAFFQMHEAASYLVGGTLAAVDAVLNDNYTHALNLGGGLHHGFRSRASGFCIYNDSAVAIKYIREHTNLKVLYVDTDAHHGDGVQSAFYDDPNVCTFSIHETGRYLFPGTGGINERGIKEGHGYTFNLPIDAFTQDESFLTLYETAFKEIAAFFKPDIIVTQNGVDAHCLDPLTHLCGTMRIYEEIPRIAHELAHKYCDGKWIAIGGGGYDMWRVIPRAWGQIWNVMKNNEASYGNLPATWKEKWQDQSPVTLPQLWQDLEDIQPSIPRKNEITEKNYQLLQNLLKYTKPIRHLTNVSTKPK